MKGFTVRVVSPVEKMVTIDEGRWVVSASTLSHAEEYRNSQGMLEREVRERTYTIVGPKPREQYLIAGQRTSNVSNTGSKVVFEGEILLVGDEPFGIISEVQKEGGRGLPGKLFTCCRQIQNGKIGEKPPIATPLLAWEAPNQASIETFGNKIFHRYIHRERGKHRWASFQDVTRIMKMDPVDAMLGYFPFSSVNHPELEVFYSTRAEEVGGRLVIFGTWEWLQESDMLYHAQRELSTVWIRPGFAMTMLYLYYFGYIPHISGTAKEQKPFKE